MNKKSAVFIGMGFELFAVILVFVYLGKWLDEKYQLGGLALMGGIVIGFVGWLIHLLALAQQLAKSNESSNTREQ